MIWLLRHGDAENGAGRPDADRELTEKGENQSVNAGRALTREAILEGVWSYEPPIEIETRVIDVHVRNLRKKR